MRREEFLAEAARVREATAERKAHLANEQQRLFKEAADRFYGSGNTHGPENA